MAKGFKVADGYVEIHADYDKRELRDSAHDAANDFGDRFGSDRSHELAGREAGHNVGDGINRGVVEHVDRDRNRHRSIGRRIGTQILEGLRDAGRSNAASSFFRSFIETISFGQADIGGARPVGALARWASRTGIALGVSLASYLILKAAEMITALSPLLLSSLVLIPIKFLAKTDKEVKRALKTFKSDWASFMKDVSAPVKPGLLAALDAIRNGFQVLRSPVRDFFAAVSAGMGAFTKGLMGGIVQFFRQIHSVLPSITAGLKQWGIELPKIGRAVGGFFKTILSDTDLVKKAIQGTSGFIQGLIGILAKLVLGLTYVSASLGNFVRLIQIGFANSILPAWLSRVTQAWGPLKDAILRAWDAFKKFATATGDQQILSRFQTLMQRIKEIWGPLKDFLGAVFKLGWDLVKQIWNTYVVPWFNTTVMPWLKQKGRELINAMMDELVKQAKQRFISFVQSIPGMLSGMVSAIAKPFTDAAQKAKQKAQELVDGVVRWLKGLPGKAGTAVSGLWDRMSGAFSKASTNARQKATELVTRVVTFLRGLPGKAASAVSGLWSRMSGAFSRASSSARQRASELVSRVVTMIRTLPGKAAAALSGLPGRISSAVRAAVGGAVAAGSAIASGVARGIRSGLGWVTSAARSLASAAVRAAKSALGIASPSKVFAEEVGKPSAQGIGVGMRRQLPQEMKDLHKMVPDLSMATANASAQGQAHGAAFQPTINVHVQAGLDPVDRAARRALIRSLELELQAFRKDYANAL